MNNTTREIFGTLREVTAKNGLQNQSDVFLIVALMTLAFECRTRANLSNALGQARLSASACLILNAHLNGVWVEAEGWLSRFERDDLGDAAFEAFTRFAQHGNAPLECFSPVGVNNLIVGLLTLSEGDSFIDLGCGSGSLLKSALEERSVSREKCVGIEINPYWAAVSEVYLALDGARGVVNPDEPRSNAALNSGDMFAPMNFRWRKYDKVVCVPPFGLKNGSRRVLVDQFLQMEHPLLQKCGGTLDWTFVARAASSMEKDGRAVVIIPAGSMFSKTELPARRYFVEREMIEAIVELPERIFSGTSIRTCAVVLRNGCKSVKMIDATRLFSEGKGYTRELVPENVREILSLFNGTFANTNVPTFDTKYSRLISCESIVAHDYDLSPSAYSDDCIEYANDARLDSVVEVRRGTPLSVNHMKQYQSNVATNVRMLSYSDIDDDGSVNAAELPYLSHLPVGQEQFCATDGDLIVTRVGATCKSAVLAVPAGEQIICCGGVYVCTVNRGKANAHYIKAFLESPEGRKRLDKIMRGNVQRTISIADLKGLKLPLPALAEQTRIGEHFLAAQDDIAVLKRKLQRARDMRASVFNEYIKEA